MEKLRIAVLFGGCSDEYPISLQSAYAVITHLDKDAYELLLIGITREGTWRLYRGKPENIRDDTWQETGDCSPAIISPSRDISGIVEWDGARMLIHAVDAALPILHGKNGEDGTVQSLIELSGIPVIGCSAASSALCMDKDKAHKLVSLAGIKTPRSHLVKTSTVHLAGEYADEIGYPVFVKPVKSGSSFGISKVERRRDLDDALGTAFDHDGTAIIEEAIQGFEVGCAILGNDNLIIGAIDEIELSDGFFDFEEKYTLKTSTIHVPARIPDPLARTVQETAVRIYRILDCACFARVDMFLTPEGDVVFNEVNTIPGFTDHSRYPSMLKAIGMGFGEIIDTAIDLALKAR